MIETLTGDDSDARQLVNELFAAFVAYFLFTRDLTQGNSFALVIRGGRYKGNIVSDATLTLGASVTTYVEADSTTGAISANTSGYTTGRVKIGIATTNDEGLLTWQQDFPSAITGVA